MSTRFLSCLTGVVCVVVVAGCGGGDSGPKPGASCVVNSECNNPLSCTAGKCHEQCVESRDCDQAGARCVKDTATNMRVCQLPEEMVRCGLNSDCKLGLKCAKDLQCRNECEGDQDCGKNQTCTVEKVCADKGEFDPTTKMLNPPLPLDGGTTSTGGAGGGGGGTGGAGGTPVNPDGGATDGPMAGSGGGTDGPPSTTPVPVSGVTIDKMIVRQGETGINATVTATGGGLSNPTNIDIGGPMGCRGTPMDGATDTMFVIRITCPHGVPLGPKNLTFQTAKGVGMYPNLLTISAITSAPTGMDTNRGTSDSPFRTFKKALSVADKGDIIELKDGTYDKDAGEDFMAPIPTGITITGQSAAGTKLIGPPDTSISVDGIKLREAGPLTVKNLTLAAFRQGINVDKPADLTLDNVKITRSRQQGVYLYYSMGDATKINWTGDESEISDNGSYAVQIYVKGTTFNYKSKGPISSTAGNVFYVNVDDSNVTLENTTLTSVMTMPLAQVLSLANGVAGHKLTLTNVTLNGQSDIGGKDKTEATITGSTFNLPPTYSGTALDFTGAKLTMSKTTFNGGAYHLNVHSGDVTLRDTKFKEYYYHGIQVSTAKKLDLGNMAQPGFNDFTPNPAYASSYAIYDTRAADLNPITVRDATVNANLIPAGTYEGPGMQGPPKSLYIQTAKNQIIVY